MLLGVRPHPTDAPLRELEHGCGAAVRTGGICLVGPLGELFLSVLPTGLINISVSTDFQRTRFSFGPCLQGCSQTLNNGCSPSRP